jgi:hypothetical protein
MIVLIIGCSIFEKNLHPLFITELSKCNQQVLTMLLQFYMALERHDGVDISRAWETIKENKSQPKRVQDITN